MSFTQAFRRRRGAMRRFHSWSAFQFAYTLSTVMNIGVVHTPPPVEIGDLIATADSAYRIVDVVTSPPGSLIAALCRVRPERLHVVAG